MIDFDDLKACPQCGSSNLKFVFSRPHSKLVCSDCKAYEKFLSKQDALLFSGMKKKERESAPPKEYLGDCLEP